MFTDKISDISFNFTEKKKTTCILHSYATLKSNRIIGKKKTTEVFNIINNYIFSIHLVFVMNFIIFSDRRLISKRFLKKLRPLCIIYKNNLFYEIK